jgi:formate/nitrite transporter FocA (FNT family)
LLPSLVSPCILDEVVSADETAHYSDLYAPAYMVTLSKSVAVAKTSQDWGACLLRGIGCNFLGKSLSYNLDPRLISVCIAIWLSAHARDTISKVAVLHFPIMAFVFLGFEHVIVNMFYIPIGMINGADVGVGRYIWHSMIPSLIGNIIGGLILGIPMVLMHQPVELPMFRKKARSDSVVVREEEVNGSQSSMEEAQVVGKSGGKQ